MQFYNSGMATKQHNIPVAMDAEFLAEIDAVAGDVKDSRSGVMRRAIRAGLPLVKSGGEVVRLGGELADLVGKLAAHHKRSREGILADAVQHGIEAVNVKLMVEEARANGVDEGSLAAVLRSHEMDLRPEKRAAWDALRAKGAVEIQLEDLLRHCPEAMERKALIERHSVAARKRYGSFPKMWGSNVDTPTLKQQVEEIERELAEGKGPDQSTLDLVAALKGQGRVYAPSQLVSLPDAGNPAPAKPAPSKPAKRKAKQP